MSVKIRMTRMGRTNRPQFRIVATDTHFPRDGKNHEILGTYDPIAKDKTKKVTLNEERIKFWLSRGALPSMTVSKFLRDAGIRKGPSPRVKAPVAAKPAAAPERNKSSRS